MKFIDDITEGEQPEIKPGSEGVEVVTGNEFSEHLEKIESKIDLLIALSRKDDE